MHDLNHDALEIGTPESGRSSALDGFFEIEELPAGIEGGEFEAPDDETPGALAFAEEMEFASDLMGARSDGELDQFLGGLMKRVSRGLRKTLRGGVGKALGGALKGIAKTALPTVAGIAGNMVLPGIGGAIGSSLASAGTDALGLEFEGVPPAQQPLEAAKRVVRLAADATAKAVQGDHPAAAPVMVAKAALASAARQHAPALLGGRGGRQDRNCGPRGQSGRWMRRGDTIVLLDG